MFLRISDVLTNLLIRDLRLLDGVNPTSCEETNIMKYEKFLNETCKIHFKWISADDHKDMKWCDLTGPEKHRLFSNINIPKLFPLSRGKEIQKLWDDFYSLIKTSSKNECDPDNFQKCSKEWIDQFTSLYQSKDVTPYMHALAFHVPEFLKLYDNNITIFNQQGLEKLNDTTKYFQRATNHRDTSALQQILLKSIRLKHLQNSGYSRKKAITKCSQTGHNKRTCPMAKTKCLQELNQ